MERLFEIKDAAKRSKLQKIHDFSCKILETTGIKLLNDEMLDALESNGCKIDRNRSIAYIPTKLIESKLEDFSNEIRAGRKQRMIQGAVCFDVGDRVECKLGSFAPRWYDWDSKTERQATEEDLINSLRFGEAVNEIGSVGVAVYTNTIEGKKVDPNFTPIVNAMMISRYTKKIFNSEINSAKQLKYLMEMGAVVRGSMDAFKKNPCFITAKLPVSPLILDRPAAEVLVALVKNDLPAQMIPMPIMGAGVPITISGACAVTNAVIIGIMTALRCISQNAMMGGGSMASYMDMMGKGIKFNVIDAIKVDMVMSQLHEVLYGFDYGYGIYSVDSKSLNENLIIDKFFKLLGAFFVRKFNYVLGMYDQGMAFSPELALIEIDIVKALDAMYRSFETDDLNESFLEMVKLVGTDGNYLAERHTLNNIEKAPRFPIIEEDYNILLKSLNKDIYETANIKFKNILKNANYKLDEDKSKEIDRIVAAAHKDIIGIEWKDREEA